MILSWSAISAANFERASPGLQDPERIQNDTCGKKLPAIRKLYLTKFRSPGLLLFLPAPELPLRLGLGPHRLPLALLLLLARSHDLRCRRC